MELSAWRTLNAMVGPHDLLDAGVLQSDRLKEVAAGVVRLEGAMILGMPVASEKYMLVSSTICLISAQAFNHGEYCFVLGDAERATSAEVVLDINDNQSRNWSHSEELADLFSVLHRSRHEVLCRDAISARCLGIEVVVPPVLSLGRIRIPVLGGTLGLGNISPRVLEVDKLLLVQQLVPISVSGLKSLIELTNERVAELLI